MRSARQPLAPVASGTPPDRRRAPITAGILLGMGLGGFFDGIVLHQILQWHHMVSRNFPPDTVGNLQINTLADGIFHAATYVLVAAGVFLMWRAARRPDFQMSGRLLTASLLTGFGAFNLVEGSINHHLLQIHHVNETVVPERWIWWDAGFLAWGAIMLGFGLAMLWRDGNSPHLRRPG